MELYQQIGQQPGVNDRPWRNQQDIMSTTGDISFDLDGVLANFTRSFTRVANRLFGTPVSDMAAQQHWMFEDVPELGLDKAKCDAVWKIIKESKGFWANLDPFNASIMFTIENIKNKVFITNRLGIDPQAQSEFFLRRWGVTDAKVIVAKEKGPIAVAENVVAHIDDYYPNCTDIKAAVPGAYVALLYTPYNKIHHAAWLGATTVKNKATWLDYLRMREPGTTTIYTDPLGDVVLSVDQFIMNCDKRNLIQWT